MAQRQTNELVEQIRLQRQRVARSLGVSEWLEGTVAHARRHPLLWIVGGTAVGALSARLLVPVLLRASRGVASHWLHSTIQGGVLSLAQGALWSFWPPGVPDEVHAEWEDAPSNPEDAPVQASGGPVEPLRSP